MAKRFNSGYDFLTALGLKTGQDLLDLIEQASFAIGTTALDQSTIEDDGTGAARVKALGILTAHIANLNVTAGKLAADAVETTKIKDDAVTTAKILDANVTAGKLAANAVETVKIKDANVTKAKIENFAGMTLLGNMSGAPAAPTEVAIIDDDTMATALSTNIPTAESIVAYILSRLPTAYGLTPTLHIIDEKPTNTSGGTFTSGSWQPRDFNTKLIDNIVGASINLATMEITLPTGTYEINIICPAYRVNNHRACLYNVTTNAVGILGQVAHANNGSNVHNSAFVRGTITIATESVFKVMHYGSQSVTTNGFGLACNFGTQKEIYTDIIIKELA